MTSEEKVKDIKEKAASLYALLGDAKPFAPEHMQNALERLEECVMWAVKALENK